MKGVRCSPRPHEDCRSVTESWCMYRTNPATPLSWALRAVRLEALRPHLSVGLPLIDANPLWPDSHPSTCSAHVTECNERATNTQLIVFIVFIRGPADGIAVKPVTN
jgi:hypothetical protein